MKKLDVTEFIKRAKEVHGDKYDYSKSKYIDYDTKLEIICKEHGSFWQTPGNHLKGKGCPFCKGNAKMTKEAFIKKAKERWGNRFDYSLVEYENNSTKVCIIDSDGKKYYQTPANHLYGFDCSINAKVTTEDFIKRAQEVHGDKYCYNETEFVSSKDKLTIICPLHGKFSMLPHNHLSGQGCPKCKQKSVLETNVSKILNENKIVNEPQKRFNWLGKKSIDFYLTNLNIGVECQGKEHLYETGQWENFETVLNRDIEKYNLCEENGIKIIYVIPNKEKKIPEFYNGKIIMKLNEFEDFIKKQK